MGLFPFDPSDPNDPVKALHNQIINKNESYFRDTMNKLSIAYGDEWTSLSKKEILVLEQTLASGLCWPSAFLNQEDNQIDVETFYKVSLDAAIRLDAHFKPVPQVSEELRQQVFDMIDSELSITKGKAAESLGISFELFESIWSKHPKFRESREFDICLNLLVCGMNDPERMAALVGTTIDIASDVVNSYGPFLNASRFKKKKSN
ncbi:MULTISPECIES: hypothetical protein [unclassified Prochlorococcus]|uniref:hypothetical protein n=1 Tax=unclassified Prochlorococcus TaxID=2627481 RepID=UPI000533AC4C|nr:MULTISPECIES: hypothetical protein [unclassified Prochlorococcus]KGG28230.1 hypothetical protein EV12_0980 [Prochlorococcus sp. MIT 0701]KGG37280.1 hypothetical protein EV14_0072 [Prochlorococcus sp. MIT 0703]